MVNKNIIKIANCRVADVASYLIHLSNKIGEPLTNMKLQKLLYYSYAWYLVEKKNLEVLFSEEIEAWQYGPVVPASYDTYSKYGADIIKSVEGDGDLDVVTVDTKKLIEEVFVAYADKTAIQLMHLTHIESPWLKTYDANNFHKTISDDLIFQFYLEKKNSSFNE